MSRILEFQHADEQTVVARVLLELHQAIDLHFPQAKGSSRQFSKTILASQGEGTAIDNQPAKAAAEAGSPSLKPVISPQTQGGRRRDQPHPQRERGAANDASFAKQSSPSREQATAPKPPANSLEFSRPGSMVQGMTATMMGETTMSRWLTRIMVLSLFGGAVLLAWIYMFGVPH